MRKFVFIFLIAPALAYGQNESDALRLELLKCRMDLLTAPIEERYQKLKAEHDVLLQKFQVEMKKKADEKAR